MICYRMNLESFTSDAALLLLSLAAKDLFSVVFSLTM